MNPKDEQAVQSGIVAESSQSFGGSWTELKLDLVASYLEAYSTALKNKGFGKTYVDAFAGTGYREMIGEESETPCCKRRRKKPRGYSLVRPGCRFRCPIRSIATCSSRRVPNG